MDRSKEPRELFPQIQAEVGADAATAFKIKSAEQLRAGLRRVHTRFVAFVVACVAALPFCSPRLADEHRVDALADLAQLSSEIDVTALRSQIAQAAERHLAFDLEQVARAVALPEFTAKQGEGPQAQLLTADAPALASLGALAGMAQARAQFPVQVPSHAALAASLRWRLDRLREKNPIVLTRLQLSRAVSQVAVDTEVSVEPARLEALQTVAAYEQSYEHYTKMRDHTDLLGKMRMSKKDMLPVVQERVAAYKVVAANKDLMRQAKRKYEHLAARARRGEPAVPKELEAGRLVVATLEREGYKPLRLEIAMARSTQFAVAPAFAAPAALTRLQDNALWPELRSLDAPSATKQLQQQISFHLRSTKLAGVRVYGVAALQAFPLVVLIFGWALARGCRAVTRVYSPFGCNHGAPLPTPGTGKRDLDRALLMALPIAVCGLICWALFRLEAELRVAALLSLAVSMQALLASRMWKELHRLLDIARHRSLVQPLPESPVGASVARWRQTGGNR